LVLKTGKGNGKRFYRDFSKKVAGEVDLRRKNDNNFKKYGLENHDMTGGSTFTWMLK
jgi:hypothetical protein